MTQFMPSPRFPASNPWPRGKREFKKNNKPGYRGGDKKDSALLYRAKFRDNRQQETRVVQDRRSLAIANSEGGYIALICVIVIGLILLAFSTTVSSSGFFTRFNSLDGENKRASLSLAESCVNMALLKIAQNQNYVPLGSGEAVNVGADQCVIKSVIYNPTSGYDSNYQKIATITTEAKYPFVNGAFSRMSIQSTVRDPNQTAVIPPTLMLNLILPPGADPSLFSVSINGSTVAAGVSHTRSAGAAYAVSASAPSGYTTAGWAGDCSGAAASGNTNTTLNNNRSYACNIYYSVLQTTANITVVANITPIGGSSTLKIKNNSTAAEQTVNSGQQVQVPAGDSYTISATTPLGYQPSLWSGACNASTGVTGQLSAGQNYVCAINFSLPTVACADTVMILDRSGSMTPADLSNERAAAVSLLQLYDNVTPPPQVGIGSFGAYPNQSLPAGAASVPTSPSGQLTGNYGVEAVVSSNGPKYPSASIAGGQWTNPNDVFSDDNMFVSDSVSGDRQAFGNFGLNIPAGFVIKGIEAVVEGKAVAPTQNSATLFANGQGTHTAWVNGEATVDETGAISCAISDSISSSISNQRESVNLNLSSIPNGSTITSVQVFVSDVASGAVGGSYQTFVRNGADFDSEINLATTGTSGCTLRSQVIDIPDFVKTASTDLEIGVLKTAANANTVRIGAIRAVVTYSVPGTIGVNLSYNNGVNWTAAKTATLTSVESASVLGGSADVWGRTWSTGDFANGKLQLRFQNNSVSGVVNYIDYVTLKVYYATPSTGLYRTVELITGSNSGVGTDIGAAINTGKNELNSVRHIAGLQKVMILVSDGKPSKPTGILVNDTESALIAADSAKQDGIQIFTVRYSDNDIASYKTLLAQIASGNAAVSGHQPGSANDQSTPAAENNDDDNFFITPLTAGEMSNIFDTIGTKVCPAAAAASGAALNVNANVVNTNGGLSTANDFPVTVKDKDNMVVNPFSSSISADQLSKTYVYYGMPAGSVSISQSGPSSGYYPPQYIDCPLSIGAGETAFCIIMNYDSPPLPAVSSSPQPSANMNINSWQEQP